LLIYDLANSICSEVREFATKYPDIIVIEEKARSRDNEPLFLLRLTDPNTSPPGGQDKLKILITFGEHAREFLPVESFFK
jgi:hypothetical protein